MYYLHYILYRKYYHLYQSIVVCYPFISTCSYRKKFLILRKSEKYFTSIQFVLKRKKPYDIIYKAI